MLLNLSIIVPVYNSERFIDKCLSSLLGQTMKNLEIIVVDDKGVDNSMKVVRELKESKDQDNQIRILEMERNSGAAAARNYGLHHANGEYVAFVDSDDWCEPTTFAKLYSMAKANDCDWCYADAIKDYPDGRMMELHQPEVPSGDLNINVRKKMLSNFVAYFTTGIYKREFLQHHHIEFPLFRFSEDSFFVWKVVMHAQRFAATNEVFYHYVIQPNSVSNTYDSTKHLQKIEVFSSLIKQLREEQLYLPYKAELDYLYIKKGFFIPLVISTLHNENDMSRQTKPVFDSINKIIPDYKKNPYYKKNYPLRFLVFLSEFFPHIFKTIMKQYAKNRLEMF